MCEENVLYENGVLKNDFNIKNDFFLYLVVERIFFEKIKYIDDLKVEKFDISFLKELHRYLYGDVFNWAGNFRDVKLIREELITPKYSVNYSLPNNIENDLLYLFEDLLNTKWNDFTKEELSYVYARKIALIWKVHPFRDGNTKTMICFSYLFAKKNGFEFDLFNLLKMIDRKIENNRIVRWSLRDYLVLACLNDEFYPEPKYLANIFYDSFIYDVDNKIMKL